MAGILLQATGVREAKQNATAPQPSRRRAPIWLPASAILALCLFAALNVFLWGRFGDDKVGHNLWNGSGSIDIAVDEFARLKQKPHVVLLGSSLMMYPFWAVDLEDNPQVKDIFHHRRSVALEKLLVARGEQQSTVYSFAIFGQMVSDAYLYVNEFLKGSKTPDYLVFGIAPRDFHDNDLPAPMATISFKRLVDLNNFSGYANLYLPSLQDKIDWLMGRACYFYSHRWRLQHDVSKFAARIMSACGIECGAAPAAGGQAGFMLAGTPTVRWNSSLAEYKRRYTNIDGKDVDLQFAFLDKLLAVCQQRHIHVIVINMPLSERNRQLLPPDFYDNYRHRIDAMTASSGARFLDLGASPDFTDADFWDSTHLNHIGGRKLINRLAAVLPGPSSR